MRNLKVLPESVRSSLRSGIILFDLTRVVEELVFNSLDAGATKVIVAVGVGTNYIKVTDNGCGITRDGLMLLGERYATSKFEQLADMNTVPESFGFRGEALSSISDVSLLEVVTKAHGMPNGYRKVIKGSKCLYLGIDDDRHDVGTTVVVRDLFYNQPVRRRHLQSSPKKVLHSVKECILRIALVHLGTCFKLIDTESGDEILCLYPSSSPLPLLMSGFGTEVSSSLHKLDASDGELKLSGYISGPYETFSVKAFQYFYISSRYISRGPIHKLLNQLATMHSCLDVLKADNRSECGKRNRCQASPTYILNLHCPRSHYDISFEPAKTCVAFKDWDPVFTFIKRAISSFWSQGAHMPEEDDVWSGADTKPTRDDYLNSYELPKKKHKTRSHQASIAIFSPQLEIPREDLKLSPFSRYACNRSQTNTLQPEDYGIGIDFASLPDDQLNFSARSSEGIYLESKCIGESSSTHVDHFLDAKWNPKTLQTDFITNNTLVVKEPSAVSFKNDDDDDLMKPFLRSCSSRMNPGSTRGDNQFRYEADGYKKWLHTDDNGKTEYLNQGSESWLDVTATVWSPHRITTTCNMGADSSFLSKESCDSLLTDGDCFTEDASQWASPVAPILCSKSSRWSSKIDWASPTYSEKRHVEPIPDVDFMHHRDDGFEFSLDEEEEKDIFNFDNMRCSSSHVRRKKNVRFFQNDSILSPQQTDFLYETEWTPSESYDTRETCLPMSSLSCGDGGNRKISECRFEDKQSRRSSSAPPIYRGKKKFVSLNSCTTVKSGTSRYVMLPDAPTLQEPSHLKNLQKPSGLHHTALEEGSGNKLQLKDRHDKKKIIDKAEISDYEGEAAHCHDLYNTDSVFTSKENQGALDYGEKWRTGCPWTSNIDKSGDVINEDNILDISSGILHLSGDSLLPKSVSKKCLEDSRVLQQVDKKFIPIVGGGILAIIDQHAADERIRLEDLRAKVLSGKMKTTTYLDAEQELVLPEIGYQLLNNYSQQIKNWGWICNFHAQSSASFKKNMNFLHNQPSIATLIAVPCILGVSLTDVDLLEFLQQLADTDGSSAIPPAVLRVLNYKACRGAIMFGDALLPSECSLIVEELKRTSLCFQCAHGRPTTAPLVNLVVLHKQIAKLGNTSHGSSGPWHGLSRHRPSLERALQRLSSGGA